MDFGLGPFLIQQQPFLLLEMAIKTNFGIFSQAKLEYFLRLVNLSSVNLWLTISVYFTRIESVRATDACKMSPLKVIT